MNSHNPNMSPEEKRSLERDLAAEQCLDGQHVPEDPALAADWRLKHELAALQPPALPAALRRRVLAHASRPVQTRWPLAAAAMVAAAIIITSLVQPWQSSQPANQAEMVSAEQLEELRLALNTIGDGGQLGLRLAGQELAASVSRIDLSPESLPYFDRVQQILAPAGQGNGPST
ncbi:MAG: hypothetical protein ACNA7E_10690 [Wenzhouxiangellaceae bacterium]